MNKTDIGEMIQSWENMAFMVRYISDYPECLDYLIEKATDDTRPEYWRAAWMIDKIHEKHPELVQKHLPVLTSFLLTTKNPGKKRHLLKLISLNKIEERDMALMFGFCMEIFLNAAEPVAVRVHAMQILYNIAEMENELAEEVTELIEHELELHGSAGLISRGKKLLKKLHFLKKRQSAGC